MRKLAIYIKKYGEAAGRKLYHALQSQAAHARWKKYFQNKK